MQEKHIPMIYVGIDIAKLNHFASAISSDVWKRMNSFKFTNDGDGFQMLQFRLDVLSNFGDISYTLLPVITTYVHWDPYQNLDHMQRQCPQNQGGQSRHIHHCHNIDDAEVSQINLFLQSGFDEPESAWTFPPENR